MIQTRVSNIDKTHPVSQAEFHSTSLLKARNEHKKNGDYRDRYFPHVGKAGYVGPIELLFIPS